MGPRLYTRMYSSYVLNVFINTSTWLNVIMAVGRYNAICRPMQSSRLLSAKWVRVSAVFILLAWMLLMLPKLGTYTIATVRCPDVTYYILDEGYLVRNRALHRSVNAVWAILAYFVPVVILGFCYAQLVYALRQSRRRLDHCVINSKFVIMHVDSRITSIVIANLTMFAILVPPYEILSFFYRRVS
ncbi:hypothetical protein NP493_630g00034 [Ridgeia piscesae]|uniref:G-protein coupled receptors family 1 profile domain-containing protein n=1 Tax=Ridgeia piscesae TaxID=27915 RepID=A0AAD9KT13_RIDPI|nr:hypothetical protein NP493_630g00034 [Ridgeia piscesae]